MTKALEPDKTHYDADATLALLAHDIAQGLSAITNNADYARSLLRHLPRWGTTPKKIERFLTSIRAEANSMLFDAQRVLSLISPESSTGFGKPQVVTISPEDILEEMLPDYSMLAARQQVDLVLLTENETMPAIRLEKNAIRRTFHNVLSNAIKYSYRGSPGNPRVVKIWSQRHDQLGKSWIIRFQNYGLGIEKDEFSNIGKPGFRGRQPANEGVFGQGLGLYDIKLCMHHHGGAIKIESVNVHENTYLTTIGLVFPVRTTIDSRHSKSET